eukprot:2457076-Amphidinium_carterae.1
MICPLETTFAGSHARKPIHFSFHSTTSACLKHGVLGVHIAIEVHGHARWLSGKAHVAPLLHQQCPPAAAHGTLALAEGSLIASQ